MDLRMLMNWHRGGSTILYGAWRAIKEKRALCVLESKVLVPTEWSVRITLWILSQNTMNSLFTVVFSLSQYNFFLISLLYDQIGGQSKLMY
jgi:hypothetical protein